MSTLKRVHGYLAEFDGAADLYHAAEHVRDAGYQRWDVHTPFPIHGMDKAMGNPKSILPKLVFVGGMTGTCVAFTLQTLTQTNFWSSIGLGFLQTLTETYPTIVQSHNRSPQSAGPPVAAARRLTGERSAAPSPMPPAVPDRTESAGRCGL